MSDEQEVEQAAAAAGPVDPDDPIEAMNKLHAELGRKAAELALEVLEGSDLRSAPFASVVALLKFGVELERKALLGAEVDDGPEVDPFDALAKQLAGQVAEPKTPEEG